MIRQFELVERVRSYDPNADEDALNRAYVLAMKLHGAQTRASGDPYFLHPLEVAGLLTDMRLDGASIITALLHDVVEDTGTTLSEIERLFGAEIARLVDGVTKLSRLELQSDRTKQAENFRKLVLAMSEDIRVLLVKLADRLHNMRTLQFIEDPGKRRRIALETMEIYAPLAERIGMEEWKDELEDLAFTELQPEARDSVLKRLEMLRERGQDAVARIIAALSETLNEGGLVATVSGREKRPRSIWLKMQRKNVAFEQLADIMAFRVVVDTVEQCYQALGIVHGAYPVVPGRFKDYISTPKPNGYRALHTGVIGPERQRIELQICTKEMHEVAEMGVAAHWTYKQGDPKTDGRQYRWLRELLDILEHAADPEEFLAHTKLEMFPDQVFCFTPKGDLIALPAGATPIDFAYAVHSAIGDHCASAKINGRLMPLRSQLQNGDQVEIITARSKTPSPEWERFVVTGRAKSRIRRMVRSQQRGQYVDLGKEILAKVFRHEGHEPTEKLLEPALKQLNQKNLEDLYAAVGEGQITGREVVTAALPQQAPAQREEADNVVPISRARERRGKETPVLIRGLIPGMAIHFARCCHPIPGDRIVGIVTTGKGVTIHTHDCDTLESFAHTPERWLDVDWDSADSPENAQVGRVHLIVTNAPGTLGSLSTVIAQNSGNITNLKFTNRNRDFFEMLIDIEVSNVRHLTNIIAALRAHPAITSVERARG